MACDFYYENGIGTAPFIIAIGKKQEDTTFIYMYFNKDFKLET